MDVATLMNSLTLTSGQTRGQVVAAIRGTSGADWGVAAAYAGTAPRTSLTVALVLEHLGVPTTVLDHLAERAGIEPAPG